MNKSLGRKDNHRRSMVRNLVTSLVLYEKIKTTKTRAKVVKSEADRLFTLAKKNDLAARRFLLSYLFDKKAVDKTLEILVPRFKNITSGFVRSYRIGNRVGDNAEVVLLELQEGEPINIKEIITPTSKSELRTSDVTVGTSEKDKDASKHEKSASKPTPTKRSAKETK